MEKQERIDVADVLRGIAVAAILMLHCIEHFNFYKFPEPSTCGFLAFTDKAVWDGLFFTFAGKAYAIFAMLFGFTFFIQDDRQRHLGRDFRLRFLWRLLLLFCWGILNASFYPGEVLVMFSICGLALLAVARLSDKRVLWIAVVLLLQPVELVKIAVAAFDPSAIPVGEPAFVPYWRATMDAISTGSFWETLKTNLWDGQLYCLVWSAGAGRLLQTPALMMLGMLIGRRGLFAGTERNLRFWAKAAFVGILCFFPLKGLAEMLPDYISNVAVMSSLGVLLPSLHKFAFMVFIVGSVVVLFYRTRLQGAFMKIAPYGRMSLTMYITQSLFGSFIFYPWGLGVGPHLGSTASLGVAAVIFAIQYTFAVLWLRRHRQGPLEYLWKKATWL